VSEAPGPVVIGFDGSDSGEDALALGLRLARAIGARPLLACVYEDEAPIGTQRVDAEWVAYGRDHARQVLEGARKLGGEEAEYSAVGSSSPAHGLHDVADAEGASLIVVGSTRHGARRRILPGSTGERLLHGAAHPVAVAPRGARDQPDASVQTVGCAFIDTRDGREALDWAARLAARVGGRLNVISVAGRHAEGFAPVVRREAEETYIAEAKQRYQEALDGALAELPSGLDATGEVLAGDVVDCLASLDDRDLDVLVCGSRGYGPVRRVLLGGVAARLVRRAAAPVVVVPRGED
jgi:nucleotide-binding universal stress UspA family protein